MHGASPLWLKTSFLRAVTLSNVEHNKAIVLSTKLLAYAEVKCSIFCTGELSGCRIVGSFPLYFALGHLFRALLCVLGKFDDVVLIKTGNKFSF